MSKPTNAQRPRTTGITTLALLAVCCFQAAAGQELRSNYRVLAVGINQYKLKPLTGCVTDAKEIARTFSRFSTPTLLLDSGATRDLILSQLAALADDTAPGSSVAIYLSGHGFRQGDQWYFCPFGYDANNRSATALSGTELLREVKKFTGKKCTVLLMIDSCHAGEFVRQCDETFRQLKTPGGGSLIVVASSAASQYSIAGTSHSLFTEQLKFALGPRNDLAHDSYRREDGTMRVTLGEVKRYLTSHMRKALAKQPKIMGFDREEQDFLADWSLSLSDEMVLMEYAVGAPAAGNTESIFAEIKAMRPPPLPVARTSHSLVGAWKATRMVMLRPAVAAGAPDIPPPQAPLVGGQVLEQSLVLVFDKTGGYQVGFCQGDEETVTAAGKYEFEPGSHFRLLYGNGTDALGLKSLTADRLVIQFEPAPQHFGTWRTKQPEEWVFQRVQ